MIHTKVKKFLEPAMFCHLAVLIRQGKRPEVHAKQKGFKVKDPRYMQNKKDSRISLYKRRCLQPNYVVQLNKRIPERLGNQTPSSFVVI